jgi:membrane fusion protein, multidrug efflux system
MICLITNWSLIFAMNIFRSLPLAVLPLWVLVGCGQSAPTDEPVRAVKLMTVQAVGVDGVQEFSGEVKARTEVRLGFRVGGKLAQRVVDVGQSVQPGQLLAVLDPQDFQLSVQAAQAGVGAAQTQRDLAAADLKRYETLRDQGFVSNADIERRQTVLRAAEATLAQAQAQAGVQTNQSTYTRMLADAAAVVVAVEAEPGQVLAAGAPVVRLAHNGLRDVVFSVPEGVVAQVRTGQTVAVSLWSEGEAGVERSGQVREVAASADAATRTYAVKVSLSGTDQPPLGATATVRWGAVAAKGAKTIQLPSSALWKQGGGQAVWVFDASTQTVKARTVQVAGLNGNQVVLAGGLQLGEEVVSVGAHVLSEGQKVLRYAPSASK